MSQLLDFLDNPIPEWQLGEIGETEKWWIDRQETLERSGYMLRPRFRPGWKPSWVGTSKFYLDCEDGRRLRVSYNSTLSSGYL
ncbi:hypothetical protein F5148DRAFT_1215914 [Russula earlei]|uniref:Uncharacterized protein n=1 Tax=Russula earlei TaxID=71964 RepID=A0ACC0U3A3_9AGAM|nr:hypothetical protein F5148DRAFT_1215914 [Russula earlei]